MSPDQLLTAARRRIRVVLAQRVLIRRGWIAACCSVALVVAARWISWRPTEVLAFVIPGVALVGAMVWRSARTLEPVTVARVVDDQLSSHDALGAYLQFASGPGPDAGDAPFRRRIEQRAVAIAAETDAGTAVPRSLVGERRAVVRRMSVAGLAVVVAAGLAFVDNPQDAAREQAARERAALDEASKDLRAAADDLGDDSPEARKLEALATALEQLDAQQALERLADAEADLTQLAGKNLDSAIAANDGLNASTAARPLPGANASSDAAAQLSEAAAALGSMTPEELAELAKRLADLAATQAAGAPEVAAALEDAAKAVESGDPGAAAALGAASSAQASQSGSVASRSASRQAAAAAAAARSEVSSSTSGKGKGKGKGSGSGKGEGDGEGDGEGSGSGSGKGKGKGSGTGSGQGSGQGAGGASGQIGAGQRSGSGAGQGGKGSAGNNGGELNTGTNEEETTGSSGVYAPDPTGATSGEGPEQAEGGDLGEEVGKGQAPSTRGSSTLPISDAVERYREQATRAMNDPTVPAAARDLMARYFELLTEAEGG